ncbi:outer membrane beta-barrel protein [uncultured Desulfosarcina sp.]|uniref:outer membrane protein n=1 Tax=uncultured Desulfosarcina sp. TaxID=218289 RepID=UPI0029C6BD5F|nr:outer membrane beta-barrel protein [uncultured Desulfosarcina sp.]
MIRKSIEFVAVLICLMVLAGNYSIASATEGLYIGIQGGINNMDDTKTKDSEGEMDSGYAISGFVGYDFGYFRVEGEVAYRENDIDKITILGFDTVSSGDVTAASFILNGYLDVQNRTPFTPYIGAGIGCNYFEYNGTAIYHSLTTIKYDDSETVLAYQLSAGITWDVTKALALDLSYKYLKSDDIEVSGTSNWGVTEKGETDYENQSFMIGLKWYF